MIPRLGDTDDWDILIKRTTTDGVETVATIVDTFCVGGNGTKIHIVGGCGSICESFIESALAGAGACGFECTGTDPIIFDGCDSTLTIEASESGVPLLDGTEVVFWYFKLCDTLPTPECCLVQDTTSVFLVEADDIASACLNLEDANNDCCTPVTGGVCGRCCVSCVFECIEDALFYYDQFQLTISGVISNPDYTGSNPCDCDQYNGIHIFTPVNPDDFPDCETSSGYECVYISDTLASMAVPTECDEETEGECVRTTIFSDCHTGDTPLLVGYCNDISGGGLVVISTEGPCDDGIGFGLYANSTATGGINLCSHITADESAQPGVWSTWFNPCVVPASPNCYNAPCIFDGADFLIEWKPIGPPKKCSTLMAAAPPALRSSFTPVTKPSKARKHPECADWSKRLNGLQVNEINKTLTDKGIKPLDIRRTWYSCSTGEHPAHCKCAVK